MISRKPILVVGAVAAIGAAAALFLPQAFAGRPATFRNRVYELTYRVPGDAPISIFASLTSGAWREEIGGETRISTARGYDIVDRESGDVYHRAGSARFMGFLRNMPPAVSAPLPCAAPELSVSRPPTAAGRPSCARCAAESSCSRCGSNDA